MRMRKKKNLHPRMDACESCWIRQPEAMRGHWRELYPQAQGPLPRRNGEGPAGHAAHCRGEGA